MLLFAVLDDSCCLHLCLLLFHVATENLALLKCAKMLISQCHHPTMPLIGALWEV